MEKKRITDDEVNALAVKLLVQLVEKVHIFDRQKVINRMIEIECAHIDGLLATVRNSTNKED